MQQHEIERNENLLNEMYFAVEKFSIQLDEKKKCTSYMKFFFSFFKLERQTFEPNE